MKQIKKAHALLSPSAASRWLVCTPSARLEEKHPDSESIYAKEGQLAHQLAELLLIDRFNRFTNKKHFEKELKKIQDHELYNEEMLEHCEAFVQLVLNVFQEAKNNYGKPSIYFEQQFDLSAYIEEGFGTSDVTIIAGKHLFVLDLKYGKGVPVYAEENKQGMLYGLGVFKEFEYIHDIEIVDIIIFQPRIDNTSRWAISTKYLLDWAEFELKQIALTAFAGEGEYIPGPHCQFCRASATCKAHYDNQIQLAKHEFEDPETIDDETISEILDKVKLFEAWIAAVKDYALTQSLQGKKFPGYKLVEGRSKRIYSDENNVLAQLKINGFKQKDLGKFKLKGITEMEKMIGKRKFESLLNGFLIKPKGKPVLVTEKDPRPSLNTIEQAKKDFEKDFEDSLEDDYLLD